MELILINNKKLKVMLTPDDMQRYALTCDNIDCEDAPTRRALRAVLDDASASCGFDSHDRVFIQVYPSKGGGCEIFVTRLTGDEIASAQPISAEPTPCSIIREVAENGEKDGDSHRFTLWRTENMTALISMCAALENLGGCRADAYSLGSNCCALLLCGDADARSLAAEFAVRLAPSLGTPELEAYIKERCTLICRGALPTLAALS